ncbi:hypothetical protein ACGF0D_04140 [Kitasatospora sp. NPDC048298]|uniref:hypothetical protein n=1 Tax=Kitasatospora sp. NPDC048298 TaxID=3364049 RepID=UPI00371B4A78
MATASRPPTTAIAAEPMKAAEKPEVRLWTVASGVRAPASAVIAAGPSAEPTW